MPSSPRARWITVAALALALASCGSSSGGGSTAPASANPAAVGAYSPTVDPANFVSHVNNPYLPYKPGTTWRYQGVMKNGRTPQTDTVVVMNRRRRVMGVDCVVVRDTVTSRGKPVERTSTGTPRTARATSGTWARRPRS